jgi:hypothetical protein
MRLISYSKYGISLFAILLALTVFASVGKADTTYYYTGAPFTGWTGGATCLTECGITGSFTVATALVPGQTGYLFGSSLPTSFSFTDGAFKFDNITTTSSDWGFVVNGLGQIAQWNLDWHIGSINMYSSTGPSAVCPSGCTITDIRNGGGSSAFNTDSLGTWSLTPPKSTPEPSTILLLAAGLIALTLRLIVKAAA